MSWIALEVREGVAPAAVSHGAARSPADIAASATRGAASARRPPRARPAGAGLVHDARALALERGEDRPPHREDDCSLAGTVEAKMGSRPQA